MQNSKPLKTQTTAEKIQALIGQMNLKGRDIGFMYDQKRELEQKLEGGLLALKNISVELDKMLKRQKNEQNAINDSIPRVDPVPEPISPYHFDPIAPGPNQAALPVEDTDV